ncbi:CLUMA_CG008432, isoform A [Clunio marinus]|uniref:CLUMA_CG008432, isoform A n=1 Tax=Clunio marinus TaxID=568069 RepID=A0A1J1I7K9_9DIPT|nr:CLUMA_CG008432, isoform A [Clunio marinus]
MRHLSNNLTITMKNKKSAAMTTKFVLQLQIEMKKLLFTIKILSWKIIELVENWTFLITFLFHIGTIPANSKANVTLSFK